MLQLSLDAEATMCSTLRERILDLEAQLQHSKRGAVEESTKEKSLRDMQAKCEHAESMLHHTAMCLELLRRKMLLRILERMVRAARRDGLLRLREAWYAAQISAAKEAERASARHMEAAVAAQTNLQQESEGRRAMQQSLAAQLKEACRSCTCVCGCVSPGACCVCHETWMHGIRILSSLHKV